MSSSSYKTSFQTATRSIKRWDAGDVDLIVVHPGRPRDSNFYEVSSEVMRRAKHFSRLRGHHRATDNRLSRLNNRSSRVTLSIEVSSKTDLDACLKGLELLMDIIHHADPSGKSYKSVRGPETVAYVAFWARILGLEDSTSLCRQVSTWTTTAMEQPGKPRERGERVHNLNWKDLDQVHYLQYLFTSIVFSNRELFSKCVRSIRREIGDKERLRSSILPQLAKGIAEVLTPVLFSIVKSRTHILAAFSFGLEGVVAKVTGDHKARATVRGVFADTGLDSLSEPERTGKSVNKLRNMIIDAEDQIKNILPKITGKSRGIDLSGMCKKVLDETRLPSMPSFTGSAYDVDAAQDSHDQLKSRTIWQEDADRNKWTSSQPSNNWSTVGNASMPGRYPESSIQNGLDDLQGSLAGMTVGSRDYRAGSRNSGGAQRRHRDRERERDESIAPSDSMSNRPTIASSGQTGRSSGHGNPQSSYRTTRGSSTIRPRSPVSSATTTVSRPSTKLTSRALERYDGSSRDRRRDSPARKTYEDVDRTYSNRNGGQGMNFARDGFYFEGRGEFRMAMPGYFGNSRNRR